MEMKLLIENRVIYKCWSSQRNYQTHKSIANQLCQIWIIFYLIPVVQAIAEFQSPDKPK